MPFSIPQGHLLRLHFYLKCSSRSKTNPWSMCLFVSECERLHGIIEGVIRANETTSAPSKIITSSVDNLTVWYGERDPISHRLHLFGDPCHCPDTHIP